MVSVMYGFGSGRGIRAAMTRPMVPTYVVSAGEDYTDDGDDQIAWSYYQRTIYDIGYYLIVVVILRSMIFGIILQSFAQRRNAQEKMLEEMKKKCFICSIDRTEFDRKGNGFEDHIKNDHNQWHYLWYMVRVYFKEKTSHTGMEMYVHEKAFGEVMDISWFPLNKAKVVDDEHVDEKAKTMERSLENLREKQTKMEHQLEGLSNDMRTLMRIMKDDRDKDSPRLQAFAPL